MPIFGRPSATPAAAAAAEHGHQQQQQQQALETPPVVQRQARGCEEDSTGELYSSLIHSNMQGMGRRGGAASTPDMEGDFLLGASLSPAVAPFCLGPPLFLVSGLHGATLCFVFVHRVEAHSPKTSL
jgi:hypothetical protein